MKNDLISRQAAIDALDEQIGCCSKALNSPEISMKDEYAVKVEKASLVAYRETLEYLPSAQPTLYGYKIEHLAYIARVMEKEGVTADYAVRTFDDIGRAVRMIIEEAQERVMETYERYSL